MIAMRKDSIELSDMMEDAMQTARSHRINRFFPASEERVRSIFLDQEKWTIWDNSSTPATTVPTFILAQRDVLLKEYVQGHAIDVRIRFLERTRVCEVRVELQMSPAFDLSALFDLGIDDLWEARLNAIADLLTVCAPRNARQPLERLDQQQRTLEAQ